MSTAKQPQYALLALLTSLALVQFVPVLFIEAIGAGARRAFAAMLVPLACLVGYLWRAFGTASRRYVQVGRTFIVCGAATGERQERSALRGKDRRYEDQGVR